jgi:hypothetical protein
MADRIVSAPAHRQGRAAQRGQQKNEKEFMNNHPSHHDGRLEVACYKCTAGCIHLEYANVMFTFTQEQFLSFSEVIGTTRRTLLQERQTDLTENPFANVEELVM